MKTAWALGAAFIAVVLVLIVFAVMATEMGSAERLSSTEALEGIDVPVIGTVGDFPDPAHRHVVNVVAEGRIVVAGKVVSFDDLSAQMQRWSELSDVWYSDADVPIELPTDKKVYRHSAEDILFRLDGRLPWVAADLLVNEAFKQGFIRIWIVVRHEGDGGEGALGYPSTVDGVSVAVAASSFCIPSREGYGIDVEQGEGGGTPAALYRALRALPPPTWLDKDEFDVTLRVDGRQSVTTVVQLWDAVLRAKASALGIITKRPLKSASHATLVGAPAAVQSYSLWLSYAPPAVSNDPGPMALVPRVRGLAWTFRPWMSTGSADRDRRLISSAK